MVETATTPTTYELVGKVEDIKSITTEVFKTLPIDSEVKTTILLNIEENIKQVLYNLAEKNEIWLDYRDRDGKTPLGWGVNTEPTEFNHLPNSITGVIVYYVIKGLREEFGYEFEIEPTSLKQRGLSKDAKKIAGKKRLLTRDQKNELIAKTEMNYYKGKISSGEITLDGAMLAIKDAYERIQDFEEIGYILPPKKADYPYWIEEENSKPSSL
jgi:hypothetical protein